jgi:hypothetical protein
MADVVRLNVVHKDLLVEYFDLLVSYYGSDCPLLPNSSDTSGILLSALRDAISYREYINSDQ